MKKHKKIVNLSPLNNRRFKATHLFFLLIIIGLFGRLINLQLFNSSKLITKARIIQSSKLFF